MNRCIPPKDRKIPMAPPKNVIIKFSEINCLINLFFDAPNDLRIAISSDLSLILVILILIKFRAGNSMNRRDLPIHAKMNLALLIFDFSGSSYPLVKASR